jgi:hypothetical protein
MESAIGGILHKGKKGIPWTPVHERREENICPFSSDGREVFFVSYIKPFL